jgi:cobalt/nickel transport system ATP-binding protein
MNTPAINVQNLSYRYDKHRYALNDVSLRSKEGEFVCIAGPNGSGKTTLIKHLNGLLKTQQGIVEIFGTPVNRKNKRFIQNNVGIVFQNPDEQIFFPTVKEDLAFGPRNMGFDEETVAQKVDMALELLGISHLKERVALNLSFGEKKRVAFAGILAMEPRIVVLDEPTLGVDPWSKPNMMETIERIRQNRTVILTTHDMDLMKRAERIILLWEGQIQKEYHTFEDFHEEELSCCTGKALEEKLLAVQANNHEATSIRSVNP